VAKVIEVTDQNFQKEVLESNVPTEVDFWAPWCQPCKMVSPIYDKLSEKYKDFKFCKLDVDQNQQTAMQYHIVSIPMQIFFNDGEKVDEILGAVPEHIIHSKVEEIINRFPTDEKGKLEIILNSWIDQNRKHSTKIDKWLEKAENSKDYTNILEVMKEIKELNNKLYEYSKII